MGVPKIIESGAWYFSFGCQTYILLLEVDASPSPWYVLLVEVVQLDARQAQLPSSHCQSPCLTHTAATAFYNTLSQLAQQEEKWLKTSLDLNLAKQWPLFSSARRLFQDNLCFLPPTVLLHGSNNVTGSFSKLGKILQQTLEAGANQLLQSELFIVSSNSVRQLRWIFHQFVQ